MTNNLIIDSSYLIFRSYFAYPQLTFEEKHMGAFYGFCKTIIGIIKQYKITNIYFANDLPEPTFRHLLYADYKGGRKEADLAMIEQIPLIQSWCKRITEYCYFSAGFEADDIIKTLVDELDSTSDNIYIFSSDRDLYQLFTNNKVQFIHGDTLFNYKAFQEKYGLNVDRWIDYKTMVGDNSDNLRGLDKVGPKTAIEILNNLGTLDQIFSNEIVKKDVLNSKFEKLLLKINENKEHLLAMKKLVTLHTVPNININMKINTDNQGFNFDLNKGLDLLKEYNFISLIKLIEQNNITNTKATKNNSQMNNSDSTNSLTQALF
jgi:DNA polymerase I